MGFDLEALFWDHSESTKCRKQSFVSFVRGSALILYSITHCSLRMNNVLSLGNSASFVWELQLFPVPLLDSSFDAFFKILLGYVLLSCIIFVAPVCVKKKEYHFLHDRASTF
jgi:hypothetical protein